MFTRALVLALTVGLPGYAEPDPPAAPRAPADRPAPQRPEQAVSQERLLGHLRALPVKRAPGPDEEHIRGLKETQRLLAERVRALGYEPTAVDIADARRGEAGPRPWHNLVFELKGRELPAEVLIVGAHFDAVPNSPGADDNGSGVAALVELARVLKDAPMRRTVRFVLFNLEETGLKGSTQYAQSVREEVDKGQYTVVGMVSLEMLGYYSDQPGSQENPFPGLRLPDFEVPDRGDFVGLGTLLPHRPFVRALAAAMREAEPAVKVVVFDHAPVAPRDLLRSDHAPFLALGLPGVIATDTANFRNPHYHQPTDTVETLDAARFTITTRALAGAIYRLAGRPGEADEWPPPARRAFPEDPGVIPPIMIPPERPKPRPAPKPEVIPNVPPPPKPPG